MKVAKLPVISDDIAKPAPKKKGNASVLRLRSLINDLINEVETLDESSFSETWLLENRDGINFYDEVKRFESALIRSALRRANGHQIKAAGLLNLNPSTLNAKMKHYHIRHFFYDDETRK